MKNYGPPSTDPVRFRVHERARKDNYSYVDAKSAWEAYEKAELTNDEGRIPFSSLEFTKPHERFEALAWLYNIGTAVKRKLDIDEHLGRGILWESPDQRIKVLPQAWHRGPDDYFGDPVWGIEVDRRWLVCCVTNERGAVLMAKLLYGESVRVNKP